MAKYTTQYGLPQSMVDYLNQPLPDISGIFTSPQSTSTSGTTAGTTAGTTEDESSISEEGIASLYPQVAASDDDDDYSVYNPDPARLRTLDQYSPYAYRQAMANSGIGIPSGILSDSSYLYPQNQFSGIFNLIPGIGTLSTIGKIAKSALPINPRAVLENEALGAGIRLDDIGRIVQGPGSINTAENIFAGYNLSKITPETIQKRKDMINKNMKDPKQKKAKLNALDEFEEKMFGKTGIKTKADIVFNDKSLAKDPTYKTFNQLVSEGLLAGDDDDEDLTYEEIQALKTQFKSPISTGIIPSYPGMGVTTGGGGITNINPTTGDINVGTTTVGNIYDEVALTGGGSKTPDYSNVTTGGPPSVISNPKPKPKPGSSNPKKSGGGGGGGGGGSKSSSKNSSQAGGSFNSLGFSDIRLKENIELIGKSPSNINIYKFNYKDNPTTYQGAMAHEVPWASVKHSNGYMMVDYNLIDIEFKKYNA